MDFDQMVEFLKRTLYLTRKIPCFCMMSRNAHNLMQAQNVPLSQSVKHLGQCLRDLRLLILALQGVNLGGWLDGELSRKAREHFVTL